MADRISFLINNLHESLDVEVKNWLDGLSTNEAKSKLAKEIIALSNHGGGYIFIGFDDIDGHKEILPADGELEAFTQDAIASLVHKYITPPIQCSLVFRSVRDSELMHPVIIVPGGQRSPVWAKAGSPDGRTLKNDQLYVRRPGALSEPPRTQDDWEKLIDRLVKARQAEQLDAFRRIMYPDNEDILPTSSLDGWVLESLASWNARVNHLHELDARRINNGYWTFSFEILPVNTLKIGSLKQALEHDMPKLSGWPPFTYIHRDPMQPMPRGSVIEAWLANDHGAHLVTETELHDDFWRISVDGRGFLLRRMQEDGVSFLRKMEIKRSGVYFDWIIPIYRAVELLQFVYAFACKFSTEEARFNCDFRFYNTRDRRLVHFPIRYYLRDGQRCIENELHSKLSGNVADLQSNMEESVYALMNPIYQQFEFTEIPMLVIRNIVREAFSFPN